MFIDIVSHTSESRDKCTTEHHEFDPSTFDDNVDSINRLNEIVTGLLSKYSCIVELLEMSDNVQFNTNITERNGHLISETILKINDQTLIINIRFSPPQREVHYKLILLVSVMISLRLRNHIVDEGCECKEFIKTNLYNIINIFQSLTYTSSDIVFMLRDLLKEFNKTLEVTYDESPLVIMDILSLAQTQ